jgi:hypothetical protein
MNFLELINKCLLELNYKQVNSFSELVKNDHKRIKNIINVINREICSIENWDFLLRKTTLNLSAGTTELENTINGRILYLLIDGKKYDYDDAEKFLSGHADTNKYSCMANKLLLPKFSEDKTIEIIYYTNNCVKDTNGNEKSMLENSSDESLIPMPFAQSILVYGTCLRFKANPQHFKFSYWLGMYNEAICNLKSKTNISAKYAPQVNLFRN